LPCLAGLFYSLIFLPYFWQAYSIALLWQALSMVDLICCLTLVDLICCLTLGRRIVLPYFGRHVTLPYFSRSSMLPYSAGLLHCLIWLAYYIAFVWQACSLPNCGTCLLRCLILIGLLYCLSLASL